MGNFSYKYIPRGQNPVFGVHLTWAVVNTCWVSTCSGDLPAQLLGGQPWAIFCWKKMAAIFQNGRHVKVILRNIKIMFDGTSFHHVWDIILKRIKCSTR